MAEALGVGMVGYAFMGAAHSQAWRTAPHAFDLPLRPVLAALCGRDRAATEAARATPPGARTEARRRTEELIAWLFLDFATSAQSQRTKAAS